MQEPDQYYDRLPGVVAVDLNESQKTAHPNDKTSLDAEPPGLQSLQTRLVVISHGLTLGGQQATPMQPVHLIELFRLNQRTLLPGQQDLACGTAGVIAVVSLLLTFGHLFDSLELLVVDAGAHSEDLCAHKS